MGATFDLLIEPLKHIGAFEMLVVSSRQPVEGQSFLGFRRGIPDRSPERMQRSLPTQDRSGRLRNVLQRPDSQSETIFGLNATKRRLRCVGSV